MGRKGKREGRRGVERETDPPGEHWGNHGSEQPLSWVGALKHSRRKAGERSPPG